jgi:hypothetical protein
MRGVLCDMRVRLVFSSCKCLLSPASILSNILEHSSLCTRVLYRLAKSLTSDNLIRRVRHRPAHDDDDDDPMMFIGTGTLHLQGWQCASCWQALPAPPLPTTNLWPDPSYGPWSLTVREIEMQQVSRWETLIILYCCSQLTPRLRC